VSRIKLEYPPGATPLDPNEMNGLIPDYISTQGELNLLEQENILEAEAWARGKKTKSALTDQFIRELHKRMFKNVWKWAGLYRRSGKNIGVPAERIPEELRKLCYDTEYWIKNKTYPWDELGARFHHRLVWIHAFANGNGRHARLLTDILLMVHEQELFSWGAKRVPDGDDPKQVRLEYLTALKEADQKIFDKLFVFMRS
jgi:Fic-DOC domain mobile mystery protein B